MPADMNQERDNKLELQDEDNLQKINALSERISKPNQVVTRSQVATRQKKKESADREAGVVGECPVCSYRDELNVHYGVLVCNPCRRFFSRRNIRQGKNALPVAVVMSITRSTTYATLAVRPLALRLE